MTDDLIARPGDSGLDCHLTGLRLSSVVEVASDEYVVAALLTFSTMDAGGSDETRRVTYWPDGKHIEVGFAMPVDQDCDPAGQMAVLHEWLDRGAFVEMTCAPGKATLLRSKGECVVLPRSETVSAGR